MTNKVKPIPDGYHSITPYLVVDGAAKAIDFYKKVFGATEIMRMTSPDGGRIGHAELRIGNSPIMLADEHPEMNIRGPHIIGGTPVSMMVYLDDVDTVAQRAVAAGRQELRPVANQFYGDRSGTFLDPFGHMWTVSTHVEDVPPDEMEKRAAAAMAHA